MKLKKWKRDDRGSALVVLLIVTIFLTIIATILIFVTGRSYKARQMNYQSKQNFYESEKALDELKVVLVEVCSESCTKAYEAVLDDYMNLSVQERQVKYQKAFVQNMENNWANRSAGSNTNFEAVKSVLSTQSAASIESVGDIEGKEDKGYFIIKDIVVSHSAVDGYYTRIRTDIRVDAPSLNWNPDAEALETDRTVYMMDYVVFSNWKRD